MRTSSRNRIRPRPRSLHLWISLGALALATACDLGGGPEVESATAADSDDSGVSGATMPSSGGSGETGDSGSTGGETGETGDSAGTGGETGETGDTGETGETGDADGPTLPDTPYSYNDPLPPHFLAPIVGDLENTPADNPITDAGATLGRVLFYDTALSQNEAVACGSCHQQGAGFSDPETFSEGFDGGHTGRNSMGLANSRWAPSGRFFWDERAATLEEQVLQPIQNEVEMGLTLDELVARVAERPYYDALFIDAFGDDEVTSERISRALAQFVRAMASYRTRFDEGVQLADTLGAPFPNFTPEENQGKAIFLGPQGGCAACHLAGPPPMPGGIFANEAILQPVEPLNNGLDGGLDNPDNGVGDVSDDPMDNGLFKSPSLRNIAVTAPYMHDGRFATLAEVVDFYSDDVQPHVNLDPRLRDPQTDQPRRLNLSPAERQALVAFLETLTDEALLDDVRFSDPFAG